MNEPLELDAGASGDARLSKHYTTDGDGVGFFSRLRISTRVIVGFCFVLLILVAIVFLSNSNTHSFSRAFNNQLAEVGEAQKIFEIDKKISELQKYILIYSHTGQSGALRRAKIIDSDLLSELAEISASYKSRAEKASTEKRSSVYGDKLLLAQKMEAIVRDYPRKIEELAVERTRSETLVNQDLSESAESIEKNVSRLRLRESRSSNEELLQRIVGVERGVIKQQRQMLVFFYNRDFSRLEDIKATFSDLNGQLKSLRDLYTTEQNISAVDALITAYNTHEDIFYQAMQANRGYLYLVNVVLAGETAEFLSLSESLRILTLEHLVSTAEDSRSSIDQIQNIANIASIAAITVGLVLAFVIGASIALPLRGITWAVSELAKGKSTTKIPGLERGDEIGQIARAADVFKETNARTKNLLAQTQRLAADIQQREEMLKIKTAELEKSNEDLDNFAYVASHDLKSPLRGIDNLATWIEEDCGELLPQESAEHLKTLRSRIARMENLLGDLLRYSRAGKVADRVEEVDVQHLAHSVFELLDSPEGSKLIMRGPLPKITTQKTPLQQVLLNLFTNAIKYSDKLCPKIEMGCKQFNDDYYEFFVADDGPGIEVAYHHKIFQMFQTLQARDIIEGSGMGLAIIKRVIEGFGGRIRVESAPGEGAVFYFTWPKNMAVEVMS